MNDETHFDTRAIHKGAPRPTILGAVNLPIFQSSTYLYDPEQLEDGVRYHRLNNSPQHKSLGEKLASLEGMEAGLVTSSGMSAIATTLLALTEPGDHVLAQERQYAGTRTFFDHYFPNLGREVSYFNPGRLEDLSKLITPKTKLIYVEALENPLLRTYDFSRITAFAKEHGLLCLIDNTFPSPVNFQPATWGFDVVLHSATKYLNGHSDIIAGCIMGTRVLVEKVRLYLNVLGGCLDPNSCYLLARGLKTLGVRVRQHNHNAMELALALSKFKSVDQVTYPGLKEHPDHELARKYFTGFGGVVTFNFKGTQKELDKRLEGMKLAFNAPSLGGPETLITLPTQTSFATFSQEEKRALGLSDTLVRVAVGLEDARDLITDFKQAFDY